MKFVYYGFGGFIGFVCGLVIQLIFYMVEQSGNPVVSNLVRDYGLMGRFLAELIESLHLFGIALGIILVRLLFRNELDSMNNGDDQ